MRIDHGDLLFHGDFTAAVAPGYAIQGSCATDSVVQLFCYPKMEKESILHRVSAICCV